MKINEVLIAYLNTFITGFKIKAEYSTDDSDTKVIVVQQTDGDKVVFFGDCRPLFDYFSINIFGTSIQEEKETADLIGNLIGQTAGMQFTVGNTVETWRLMFKQVINPHSIDYQDIRRLGYNLTLQSIITKVYEEEVNNEGN